MFWYKFKIWLFRKVYDFCASELYRGIEACYVEDFERELDSLWGRLKDKK